MSDIVNNTTGNVYTGKKKTYYYIEYLRVISAIAVIVSLMLSVFMKKIPYLKIIVS